MVEFREVSFGERTMIGEIESVHLDRPDVECPVTKRRSRTIQLHFIITPKEPEGWKNQNWWIFSSNSTGSGWYDAVQQFKNLGIISDDDIANAGTNLELAEKIVKRCKGKNIKFVEKRYGRASNPNWFPEKMI